MEGKGIGVMGLALGVAMYVETRKHFYFQCSLGKLMVFHLFSRGQGCGCGILLPSFLFLVENL